jgi:hypothetical protein
MERVKGHMDTEMARLGDWLEVGGTPGYPSRRGEIIEILGRSGHRHFRVRWDEKHESLVYPAQHGAIVHAAAARAPSDHLRRRVRQ